MFYRQGRKRKEREGEERMEKRPGEDGIILVDIAEYEMTLSHFSSINTIIRLPHGGSLERLMADWPRIRNSRANGQLNPLKLLPS